MQLLLLHQLPHATFRGVQSSAHLVWVTCGGANIPLTVGVKAVPHFDDANKPGIKDCSLR